MPRQKCHIHIHIIYINRPNLGAIGQQTMRIMKYLLSFLMLLTGITVSAQDFTYASVGGISLNYSVLDEENKTCQVAVNTGLEGTVVIPEKVLYGQTEYTVTAIDSYTFQECGMTSVDIPNTITTIGSGAFGDCYSLQYINIHDIATWCNIKFGYGAFSSWTSKTLKLNGEEIENLVIPSSVTAIGDYTFQNCNNITSVAIPNSVTSIGQNAFYGCSKLSAISIPNSVTYIGSAAFSGCNKLTSISLPTSLTEINDVTFSGCRSLTSIIIPNSVTSIGNSAFSGCSGLTSINIPNSVTTIKVSAFSRCGLTSIDLPNSITTIEDYTFSSCDNLISVTIPSSVTSIKGGAFEDCWQLPSIDLPNSITLIEDYAFSGCGSLQSVKIPASVTSIGRCTFKDCRNMTSIDLANSITSIGEEAFAYCMNLSAIDIPATVTSIGSAAFENCSSLRTIYYLNPTPPSIPANCFDALNYQYATLNVTQDALEAYQTAETWKEFANIQGVPFTGIADVNAGNKNVNQNYYDINGRNLSTPTKGLNIVNGKKVILK